MPSVCRSLMLAALVAVALPSGAAAVPQDHPDSRVDLVQIQLLVPAKVTLGKAFLIVDEVENQGTTMAFQTVTGFYLSLDDVLDDSDVVVAAWRVRQLGANQSDSTHTPVTLKLDIKPGDYYLLAVADAKKQIEERTRGNNIRAVRITILPAEPKK